MKEEIIVWGTETAAIQFLLTHRDVRVKYFIEGRKTIKYFYGNICFKPQEIDALPGKDYIVVASSEMVYWEIKNYLEKLGFKEFDDFCYYEIFKKKIAIIYGNCHTVPIKKGLQLSEKFQSEYGFYPLHEIQQINNNKLRDLESSVFERCDLFLHQSIRENNIYGKEYASKELIIRLKPNCVPIAISNLYGLPRFLYPQLDTGLETKMIEGKNYFPFRDRYIEELWRKGRKETEIKEFIEKGIVVNNAEIFEGYYAFIDKVRNRESEWDIKMSDWIMKNFQEYQLFYDPNHPTNIVIQYIVREIMKCLGWEEEIDLKKLCALDSYEIPIYGNVCKTFNFKYSTQNYLRQYTKHTIRRNQMDLLEYIKEYEMWHSIKK